MKKYMVSWTEHLGFFTYIEARNRLEALAKFHAGVRHAPIEPDGFREVEVDSVEAELMGSTYEEDFADGQFDD